MKNSFLSGEKIYLRPLEISDLENGNYLSWLNDEEVCRYNSHYVFPYIKESAVSYIENSRKFFKALVLGIFLKSDQRHIGNISLQNIDFINRCAEFAIILGERDCWGKGLSKDAAFLIVKHGFKSLNLNRIYCGTSEKNVAMQKLALYLGMQEEGRKRQALFKDGCYVDFIEYGVIFNEFFKKFKLS